MNQPLDGDRLNAFADVMKMTLVDVEELFNLALSGPDVRNRDLHGAMVAEAFIRLGENLSALTENATGQPLREMEESLQPLQHLAEKMFRTGNQCHDR